MLHGAAFFGRAWMAGKEQNDRPEQGIGEGVGSAYRRAGPYIDASWQLAGAVGLGTLLGWWLDKKLGTGPWLLVCGSIFVIGVGFYLFFKILTNLTKGPKCSTPPTTRAPSP